MIFLVKAAYKECEICGLNDPLARLAFYESANSITFIAHLKCMQKHPHSSLVIMAKRVETQRYAWLIVESASYVKCSWLCMFAFLELDCPFPVVDALMLTLPK